MSIMLILTVALLFVGISSAACAVQSFDNACNKCEFDNEGKMDRDCLDSNKEEGIGCYVAKYPVSSRNYYEGNCPAMDKCINKFNSCSEGTGSGLEILDCSSDRVRGCYREADTCVELAARDCGEPVFCVPAFSTFGLLAAAALIKRS
jgi:hypothetical protein